MVDMVPVEVRERLMTLREAAAYLHVNERFMHRMVSKRKVGFYKIGGLLRFDAFDLDALIAEQIDHSCRTDVLSNRPAGCAGPVLCCGRSEGSGIHAGG